jgi:hypothetical protein
MQCKRCGWALEEWQKFCPHCGTPAPRGTAPWLWGGAMVLLAGAIGLLGYRVYALHQAQNMPVAQVRPAADVPETAPVAAPAPPPKKTAQTPATPPPVMRIEEPTPRRAPQPVASQAPSPVSPPPANEPEAPARKLSTRRINIPKDDFDEPVAKAPPADTAAAPDSAAGIPVVPAGPRPSAAPRPKIGILRPERPEPAAPRGEPISPSPPAGTGGTSAQPAAAAPYTGPSAGTLIWSGDIGENTLVVINGTQVSIGRLTGELPGVPVIVQLETDDFMVIDPPGPGNGWKRLSLRSRRRLRHAVTIKWGVMR